MLSEPTSWKSLLASRSEWSRTWRRLIVDSATTDGAKMSRRARMSRELRRSHENVGKALTGLGAAQATPPQDATTGVSATRSRRVGSADDAAR